MGAVLLSACGPDGETLCQAVVDCLGGSDKDVQACVVSFDATADMMSTLGCTDEYDEFVICYEDNGRCDAKDTGLPCKSVSDCYGGGDPSANLSCTGGKCVAKDYGLDQDACETEGHAINHCADMD